MLSKEAKFALEDIKNWYSDPDNKELIKKLLFIGGGGATGFALNRLFGKRSILADLLSILAGTGAGYGLYNADLRAQNKQQAQAKLNAAKVEADKQEQDRKQNEAEGKVEYHTTSSSKASDINEKAKATFIYANDTPKPDTDKSIEDKMLEPLVDNSEDSDDSGVLSPHSILPRISDGSYGDTEPAETYVDDQGEELATNPDNLFVAKGRESEGPRWRRVPDDNGGARKYEFIGNSITNEPGITNPRTEGLGAIVDGLKLIYEDKTSKLLKQNPFLKTLFQ